MVAGRGIEPQDVAPVLPDAHQAVEAIEVMEDVVEDCACLQRIVGPRGEVQFGPHGEAAPLDSCSGFSSGEVLAQPDASAMTPTMRTMGRKAVALTWSSG